MKFTLPLAIWACYVCVVYMMLPRRATFFKLVVVPTMLAILCLLGVSGWPEKFDSKEFLNEDKRLLLGIVMFGLLVTGVFYDRTRSQQKFAYARKRIGEQQDKGSQP